MWLISAYLIGAVAPHRELTYFSASAHTPGEVVRLPVRGKESFGLITKCEPAAEARQTLRSSGYQLQKILGSGRQLLTAEFLHAAFEIAAFHAVSIGAVLDALVPITILENFEKMPEIAFGKKGGHAPQEPELIIGARHVRRTTYAGIVKTSIKSASALIIAPTIVEAERIAADLPHATVFHSGLTKKQMLDTWSSIAGAKKTAVVGTLIAASLPRSDWRAIILERPLARGYERSSRPFVDASVVVHKLAEAVGANVGIGSPVKPVEWYGNERHGLERPVSDTRSPSCSIIDMQPESKLSQKIELSTDRYQLPAKPRFELFAELTRQKIAAALYDQQNVLLMTARRGLAPHTTCDDCGTPLSCSRCGSGFVLHEKREPQKYSLVEAEIRRWFECHYCGYTEKVHILCPVCGSWRLSMHGIGLTLIAREAEKLFPKAKQFVADDEVAGRPGAAKKLAAQFEQSHGAILAATENMLAYVNDSVPLSVAVSVDSMLYMPEYSAPERTLAFLSELRGMTGQEMVIQTRVTGNAVIATLDGTADPVAVPGTSEASGEGVGSVPFGLEQFYERELELRKKFRYPPFATLIRLSVSGTAERQKEQADAIFAALEQCTPVRFAGRSPRRSIVREHILIRLPAPAWIDQKLLAFIRSLPPSVEVRVNPKNVLSD